MSWAISMPVAWLTSARVKVFISFQAVLPGVAASRGDGVEVAAHADAPVPDAIRQAIAKAKLPKVSWILMP